MRGAQFAARSDDTRVELACLPSAPPPQPAALTDGTHEDLVTHKGDSVWAAHEAAAAAAADARRASLEAAWPGFLTCAETLCARHETTIDGGGGGAYFLPLFLSLHASRLREGAAGGDGAAVEAIHGVGWLAGLRRRRRRRITQERRTPRIERLAR